jgi:hypothetical protein
MNSKGELFVASTSSASVVAFASGANGNVAPKVTIAGSHTGLIRPFALTFDKKGRLLVADEDAGVIVFAKGANGNATPVATITGISYATGVVTDSKNHIYVADFSGDSIKEFAATANGNATPIHTIEGANTTLNGACYLALH